MKRKYLSFVVGLAVAIIIIVALVGCGDKRTLVQGAPGSYPQIRLVAEIEGCKIYGIQENKNAATIFFSKCPELAPSITR